MRVRGMTPSLLWNEYCDAAVSRGEEPYMYSAFCREYRAWAQAHVSMFAFFGGAAPVLAPDNCKTAASKNTKEALIVNEQYRRMSGHYGCAAVPARARRPRDKASVEMGVGLIERQAMLALREGGSCRWRSSTPLWRTRSPPSTRALQGRGMAQAAQEARYISTERSPCASG